MNGAVDRVRENASTEADMVASVNKQLIRSVFEAWANGDSKAFFNVLAPNVEWTVIGTGPVSQCYKSRQAFLEGAVNPLSEKLAGPIAPTVENIIAERDTVVVQWSGQAKSKAGLAYNNSYCWVMGMRDGKVLNGVAYIDTALVADLWRSS